MATGKVKWFNNAKGYGFILADQSEDGGMDIGGTDLFAHYSAIEMDGYKTLKAGQDVTFDISEGPKGLQATNIRGLETGTDEIRAEERPAMGSGVEDTESAGSTSPATSRVLSVTLEETADGQAAEGRLSPGKASQSH
ncbi:MAG: cold shock domain-containing protein [Pseudomonadales bacterium]|nr:cold shock domain-containing protein [Pseudomonadales bacterium]